MIYLPDNPLAETAGHLNMVLLFGLVILGGTFGARFVQKLHIPQVVGCIMVGILLGDVTGIIKPDKIELLAPFTMFALGIIGFLIGGELRSDVFKRYGKQFFIILLSEGTGAFLLVAVGTSAAVWFITADVSSSVAIGLVLGAIASATAPAATVNVLWEYKTRGPLTATVLAIVALDDAFALLLYRGAATGAKALLGAGGETVLGATILLFGEIVGSVVLGFLAGLLLYFLLKLVKANDKILELAIASLLLVVGISMVPKIDPILPAMTLGVTVANLMPRRSKAVFKLVEGFSPPIYISFFVLAGAHMEFARIGLWMLVVIVLYLCCRMAGKMLGSWLGARYSAAPATVRKYLGICLQSQAGVAIGLAILAGHQFEAEIGTTIIMVVMSATFVTEILGPMLVKVGVKKAGEAGLNITEEDLIKTYSVSDVMDTAVPFIPAGMPLSEVISVVSSTDNFYYPVVDTDKKVIGAVTLDGIRNTFSTQELNNWLVALDIIEPVVAKLTPDVSLEEAFDKAKLLGAEHLPVAASEKDDRCVGVLDCSAAHRALSAEVLSRQQKAVTIHKDSAWQPDSQASVL